MDNKELRSKIRSALLNMDEDCRIRQSATIWEKLENTELFRNSKCILAYWSLKEEVKTHNAIIEWSKTKSVVLPVVVGESLELRMFEGEDKMVKGKFGIKEPAGKLISEDEYPAIDMCIIPGVVFDKSGNRMGHGCGYYDRLLPSINAPLVGVCYTEQLVDEIEPKPWDVKMDMVIYP